MKQSGLVTLLALSLLTSGTVNAGDWGAWRGPARDGVSKEMGLRQSWPEGGPKMVWRVDQMGGGYSTCKAPGCLDTLVSVFRRPFGWPLSDCL